MSQLNTRDDLTKANPLAVVVVAVLLLAALVGASSLHHSRPAAKNTPAHSATFKAVSGWVQKYGSIINTLQADNTYAKAATTKADYALLQQACGKERTDVGTAQTMPAIPDAVAASHMSVLLSDLNIYSNSCVSGSADVQAGEINTDASQISTGADEISSAATSLSKAATEMDALNSRLHAIISAN